MMGLLGGTPNPETYLRRTLFLTGVHHFHRSWFPIDTSTCTLSVLL